MDETTSKHMIQPWARKWQSPFLIIFMNKVESETLSQSELKPLVWKRFIDDIFSLWTINRDRIEQFIEHANNHHLRLKFPIRRQHSWTPTSTKAQDSKEKQSLICGLILNQLRHFNIHILNPAPQGNKKGFIKGEALRLLRTNSSKIMFEEKITNFKSHLLQRGYPEDLINTILSEVISKTGN